MILNVNNIVKTSVIFLSDEKFLDSLAPYWHTKRLLFDLYARFVHQKNQWEVFSHVILITLCIDIWSRSFKKIAVAIAWTQIFIQLEIHIWIMYSQLLI